MQVLVVAATGRVGREVVAALGARGVTPRVLLRDAQRRAALGDHDVEVALGDLADPVSLKQAVAGVDAVFLTTPHHPDEATLGTNLLEACLDAGVGRLVLSTAIHPDSGNRLLRGLIYRVMGALGPHYRPKYAVEAAVRDSALDAVVLLPANFFQNDELFRDDILAGVYPQPLGAKGATRVDCRDVGEAAARALTGELATGVYPLVGPTPRISGPDAARSFTDALDRQVVYAGDDLDAWESRVDDRMSPSERADFRATYRLIQRFAPRSSAKELARTRVALGRDPIAYDDYVSDAAARWLGT